MAVTEKAEIVTKEEGLKLLDAEAQKCLGISGEEFLAAWDKGVYVGKADTPEVMRVVELIPFAR